MTFIKFCTSLIGRSLPPRRHLGKIIFLNEISQIYCLFHTQIVCSTITRVKLSYSLQNSLYSYIIDSFISSKIFSTFFSNRNFSRMVLYISSKFINKFLCDIYFIFFPTLPPQPIGLAGGGRPAPWCGNSAHRMTSLLFPLILSLSYSTLSTFLFSLPLLRIRPGLHLKGKGKPRIPLKGNPGKKPALKQTVSRVLLPLKTLRKRNPNDCEILWKYIICKNLNKLCWLIFE